MSTPDKINGDSSFSSVVALTRAALEAARSEQVWNAFAPGRFDKYSEWNQLETDHTFDVILSSPEVLEQIGTAAEAIRRACDSENSTSIVSHVGAVFADAIRMGWHSRGALADAQYLRELCQKEPDPVDIAEEWRRSIFEL